MKTTNFLAIAVIAVVSFTSQVVAQETETVSTKGKQTQSTNFGDRVNAGLQQAGGALASGADFEIKIVPTETGCDIVVSSNVKSPRDVASGLATGKRQVSIACCDHATTQLDKNCVAGKHFKEATLSARNTNGQVQNEGGMNESKVNEVKPNLLPPMANISSRRNKGGGTGKVSMSDLSFSVKSKGKPVAITINDSGFTMPENCPDGTYDIVANWSWGAHQSGITSLKAIDCHLKIENGVCVDMAINEKGSSGTKSTR